MATAHISNINSRSLINNNDVVNVQRWNICLRLNEWLCEKTIWLSNPERVREDLGRKLQADVLFIHLFRQTEKSKTSKSFHYPQSVLTDSFDLEM